MAAAAQPAKRAPRKRAAAATQAPAAPPAVDDRPLNEWLHDLATTPRRIEVFDRWWEFKQPTGGRAAAWDALCGVDIRAALADMVMDQTPADEESAPGTKVADDFLAAATEWVPPDVAEEFWRRFSKALFGLGEA